ncbi:MAG: tetratricopeptide repeat protein [Candidatus Kapabacteria bacterium]|nr:tetratricopeptide repeat protein [Candidatus Kapabacteria bacterium]
MISSLHFQTTFTAIEQFSSHQEELVELLSLADSLRENELFGQAIEVTLKAQQFIDENGIDSIEIKCTICASLCYLYTQINQFESVLEIYKSVSNSKNIETISNFETIYYYVGNANVQLGNLSNGFNYFQLAVSTAEKSSNYHIISSSLLACSSILAEIGEKEYALVYGQECLELLDNISDQEFILNIKVQYGHILHTLELYEESIEVCNVIIRDITLIESQKKQARILTTVFSLIGSIYLILELPSEAHKFYKKSVDLYKYLEDNEGAGKVLANIATVHERFKELKKAEKFYLESIKFLESNKESTAYLNVSLMYISFLLSNNFNIDLQFLHSLEIQSNRTNSLKIKSDLYNLLSRVYEKLGELRFALRYQKLYTETALQRSKEKEKTKIEEIKNIIEIRQLQKISELEAQTNSQLTELNNKLVNLNKIKDDFFAIASHDLKNPLGAIKQVTSLLLYDSELDEQTKNELLVSMFISSHSSLFLLNNLNLINGIQEGKVNPYFQSIDVKSFLNETFITSYSSLLKVNSQEIELTLDDSIRSTSKYTVDTFSLSSLFDNIVLQFLVNSTSQSTLHTFARIEKNTEGTSLITVFSSTSRSLEIFKYLYAIQDRPDYIGKRQLTKEAMSILLRLSGGTLQYTQENGTEKLTISIPITKS